MTNEEKAKELFPNMPTFTPLCTGIREILVEMAEWKDQQYKEIIKEECEISYESGYTDGEIVAEQRVKEYLGEILNKLDGNSANVPLKAYLFDEIINELYGEK